MNMIRSNVCPWFKNNGISGYSDGHMELLFADPTKVETINAFGQAGRTRAVAGRTNPELAHSGPSPPSPRLVRRPAHRVHSDANRSPSSMISRRA